MEPEQASNEPLLEAILQNQDSNAKSQEQLLEAILQKSDTEPLLEAQLTVLDKIEKKLAPKEIEDGATFIVKGIRGEKGDKGERGDKGDKGDPIKGDKGDKGDAGIQGIQGIAGKNGIDGKDGKDGKEGPMGPKGDKGEPGKDGKGISDALIKRFEKKLKDTESNLLWVNNGAVRSVVAGSNITIDNTDPQNPIISSTSSGGGTWGSITGTLSNQTDLQSALDLKAPLISPTFATSITGSYLTASELLITNASKQIVSAPVATYPSLTELTYLKGVTSAIQTQLNAKGVGDALTTNPLSQFASTTSAQLASVISDETGSGALVFGTSPTFTTQITSPIVYGSSVANGDLVLEGTSHATKTSSIVQIQPTSGAVLIGAVDAVGIVATGLQVTATTGTAFQVTGGNPYNPALTTTAAGNTHMYTFDSQNFSTNTSGSTSISGGYFRQINGAYFAGYQQAFSMIHDYASIGGGTLILDQTNGGGPDPTASAYKIIQAKFLTSERYYLDGNGKSLQGYDTSNYFTTTISSTGGITFDAVGSGAGFTFSDSVALGANSLTMTGSIAATGARVTKGWFTDIESTNAPTIGGTAATGSGGLVRATSPSLVTPLLTVLVEANTAGSGSPNLITSAESFTTYTNEGATALNYHTLPTAVAGLTFTFVVQDADGIRVVANTGDTIRNAGVVSASAGYIESTTIGSTITLTAINATEWICVASQGTWVTI